MLVWCRTVPSNALKWDSVASYQDKLLTHWLLLRCALYFSLTDCCGFTEARCGPAVLTACAARRWLARNAAGVKFIYGETEAAAGACTSLVSCLPALQHVELCLPGSVKASDLGSLLEALAWCPSLGELNLDLTGENDDGDEDVYGDSDAPHAFSLSGFAPAFAKLRSLTNLGLSFNAVPVALPDVVGALVSLTGLADLAITALTSLQPVIVPAALGQLTSLTWLMLCGLSFSTCEAGCFNLPNLLDLELHNCVIGHAAVLTGITALRRLTCIEFSGSQGAPLFAQLVHLPQLQQILFRGFGQRHPWDEGGHLGLSRLPDNMGSLRRMLQALDITGNELTCFPLAVTQLRALTCLKAGGNDFAELPAAVTALSRLVDLTLGRGVSEEDPLQLHGKRPLDARALGDLSAFPALCHVGFEGCEVMLCESMLGAVQHASLRSIDFCLAHPAPECALVVLELSQELRRLRRDRMLKTTCRGVHRGQYLEDVLLAANGQAPFQKFKAALEACGL